MYSVWTTKLCFIQVWSAHVLFLFFSSCANDKRPVAIKIMGSWQKASFTMGIAVLKRQLHKLFNWPLFYGNEVKKWRWWQWTTEHKFKTYYVHVSDCLENQRWDKKINKCESHPNNNDPQPRKSNVKSILKWHLKCKERVGDRLLTSCLCVNQYQQHGTELPEPLMKVNVGHRSLSSWSLMIFTRT